MGFQDVQQTYSIPCKTLTGRLDRVAFLPVQHNKIKEHKQRNRAMFNAIAHRYDLLNHLLSGGVDIYWRRRALGSVRQSRPERILDLATGTADFAIAARRLGPQRVVGVDVAGDHRVARVEPDEGLGGVAQHGLAARADEEEAAVGVDLGDHVRRVLGDPPQAGLGPAQCLELGYELDPGAVCVAQVDPPVPRLAQAKRRPTPRVP